MNRLEHLKQTLPENIKRCSDYDNYEFVILAYGDRDTYSWILENFSNEINAKKVLLGYSPQEHFRMAHAKNMAHRLATGDILVNIDADNIAGAGFANWLNEQFTADEDIIVRRSFVEAKISQLFGNNIDHGVDGRVAIFKEHFYQLNGYREPEVDAWGGDDKDLINRGHYHGLKFVGLPPRYHGEVIEHDNTNRFENYSLDGRNASEAAMSDAKNISRDMITIAANMLYNLNHPKNMKPIKLGTYQQIPTDLHGFFGCGQVEIPRSDNLKEITIIRFERHVDTHTQSRFSPFSNVDR